MDTQNKNIVSLFSGAGGLDLGFKNAGFKTIYANEHDKTIWETFEHNFKDVFLDKRDIRKINSNEIPDCIGIIGGPPCQSFSEAGSLRGILDPRGKLFYEYIRIVKDKKPLFFVAENVAGLLHARNKNTFLDIINKLESLGYFVKYKLVNAKDYKVPQDRKRLFIIGFLNNNKFEFPEINTGLITLKNAIFDLKDNAKVFEKENKDSFNHEYYVGGFSSIYMSRNRVRSFDEVSFTIQAGGRHAPLHPNAPKMEKIEKNKMIFKINSEHLYRRLSVRECARIQTFPDEFLFLYNNVLDGYKMVGNAVPVKLAEKIAEKIWKML
jgi:DNA (cytosine-5)-methyltransferase 1